MHPDLSRASAPALRRHLIDRLDREGPTQITITMPVERAKALENGAAVYVQDETDLPDGLPIAGVLRY